MTAALDAGIAQYWAASDSTSERAVLDLALRG
jgi:hypothetical protein